MATTSTTTKAKLDKTRSLGCKPEQPSSVSSEDGSDQKPEKPLPNYLKPTISSRPVKFLKKNNNSLENNNQKLLPLRSSSFHGSRCFPRGGTIVKSPHVAPKKSGLSSSSTSLKSKKEGHEDVTAKKAPEKEIALDTSSLSSTQEDEEKTLKVESDVQVGDDIEQDEDEEENIEVHVAVVHDYESGEENNFDEPTLATSPVGEEIVVAKAEEERLMNEDDSEEKEQQNNGELYEEVKKKIDEDDTSEKVDINTSLKEVESVQETTEEQEEVKEEKEVNKEDKEKVEEEENEKVKLKKKNQEKETRAK
ncbi:hypothetical protein F2Q68_00012325 [Brassica cretica]|uniref:Calmodulin-binding domain-containing protein n=1 Tax=Brassica cretica TaxID=69181 RepID=A0A3N6QX68_BRACR|nr:hypothetical protein F2Q68_00012325 [Brassica cretica]